MGKRGSFQSFQLIISYIDHLQTRFDAKAINSFSLKSEIGEKGRSQKAIRIEHFIAIAAIIR